MRVVLAGVLDARNPVTCRPFQFQIAPALNPFFAFSDWMFQLMIRSFPVEFSLPACNRQRRYAVADDVCHRSGLVQQAFDAQYE